MATRYRRTQNAPNTIGTGSVERSHFFSGPRSPHRVLTYTRTRQHGHKHSYTSSTAINSLAKWCGEWVGARNGRRGGGQREGWCRGRCRSVSTQREPGTGSRARPKRARVFAGGRVLERVHLQTCMCTCIWLCVRVQMNVCR